VVTLKTKTFSKMFANVYNAYILHVMKSKYLQKWFMLKQLQKRLQNAFSKIVHGLNRVQHNFKH